MPIALVWPLFKGLIPLWFSIRDINSSVEDTRRSIVIYDLEFPRNSMLDMVHLFKFNTVLKQARFWLTVYAALSLITLVCFSLLAL